MTNARSIHMGHGQMVDIESLGSNQWRLVFSEAGVANYKAPPLNEIKVEAIDTTGAIHPLEVKAGTSVSSVIATGQVAGAYRARVMVLHGDHYHTRESLLPGKDDVAAKAGPNGGVIASFGAGSVEAKLIAADAFELHFSSPPPAVDAVVMQAIGPKAEDYQIRNLTVRAGDKPGTLVASGKIKDATYLRLTLKSGSGAEVRSVPVIR